MALNDIVQVTISREIPSISRAAFGYPCIASEFATSKTTPAFTRFRWYTKLSDMVADGWLTSDPEYKKAAALLVQSPRVVRFGIGRKDTADADWAAALTAIAAENNEWYGLIAIPDGTPATDIAAIAAWVETQRKIYFAQSTDTGILGSGTTDIAAVLKALSLDRTAIIYHATANADQGADAAWMGEGFPFEPGSSTYAFKTLRGVSPDTLTPAERIAALGKNANIHTTVGGQNITESGTVAGGEFIDIITGTDWLEARLQEEVYAALATQRKVPYDDGGITAIGNIVNSVLLQGADRGILQADSIVVNVPAYADIPQGDRAARVLPDITFTALYQGAIHKVEINGTISV